MCLKFNTLFLVLSPLLPLLLLDLVPNRARGREREGDREGTDFGFELNILHSLSSFW